MASSCPLDHPRSECNGCYLTFPADVTVSRRNSQTKHLLLPSWRRSLAILLVGSLLWLAGLTALVALLGPDSLHVQEYTFFTKATFVTFGGESPGISWLPCTILDLLRYNHSMEEIKTTPADEHDDSRQDDKGEEEKAVEAKEDDEGAEDVSDDKVLRTLARYFLQDLIEIFYPELAPDIDFGKAEFLNGKLFSRFRKKGHVRPDVAVKLTTHDGDPQFGIFHGEFEGKFTGAMEKRLKMYFHHIALEYDDPPVIVAVFFKKGGGPKAVERKEVVRQMKSWVSNRFYYLAVNLSKCLAEKYVTLPQALAPGMAALMSSETWDRVDQKLQCLEAVSRSDVDDERRYLLTNVIDIYLDLNDEEDERFQQEMDKGERKEVKKMILTLQDAITDGKLREARKAVLVVVEHRWSSLPDDFVSKLEAIYDLDRLHEIMEQALKVGSLDEINLSPGHS